jgi:hypothetical protein
VSCVDEERLDEIWTWIWGREGERRKEERKDSLDKTRKDIQIPHIDPFHHLSPSHIIRVRSIKLPLSDSSYLPRRSVAFDSSGSAVFGAW